MGWKFDFAVVAMGDRDPGPDPVPHKSRYIFIMLSGRKTIVDFSLVVINIESNQ